MEKPSTALVKSIFERPKLKPSQLRKSGTQVPARRQSAQPAPVAGGLEPYTGAWTFDTAAHLYRRSTFGVTPEQVSEAVSAGRAATVAALFATEAAPPPPLTTLPEDTYTPFGESWINETGGFEFNNERLFSLYAWSTGLQLNQSLTLREKMVLFWHNHFVIEEGVVEEARYIYRYFELLRSHALGNFKTLTGAITTHPAMLVYLNGNSNIKEAPNENYARELFELFTIGKGPQRGEGDYTHYTEQDVLAAAKVLTGWRDDLLPVEANFDADRHDESDKVFSAAFGHATISNNGASEYLDLINMIFARQETARFLCRNLYRWFVYYEIDEAIEESVIEPMAELLVAHDYDIRPALEALLNSAHFYQTGLRGCMIKNPIDYNIGLFRQAEIDLPGAGQLSNQYHMWGIVFILSEIQEMRIGSPPSVAGWPAYHQEPQYYQTWINSAILPFRRDVQDLLLYIGYENEGFTLFIDVLQLATEVSNSSDPNLLIRELAARFLPAPLEQAQLDFIKAVLIPGLPDFEWTIEWGDYLANPGNEEISVAVSSKLRAMFRTLLTLAEFQLS